MEECIAAVQLLRYDDRLASESTRVGQLITIPRFPGECGQYGVLGYFNI